MLIFRGFPGGSVVKNLPGSAGDKELQVSSLGWDDPLEEDMATHSSILAWKILWTEEPAAAAKSLQSCPTLCDPRDSSPPGRSLAGYNPKGPKELDTTEHTAHIV